MIHQRADRVDHVHGICREVRPRSTVRRGAVIGIYKMPWGQQLLVTVAGLAPLRGETVGGGSRGEAEGCCVATPGPGLLRDQVIQILSRKFP